MTSYRPTSSISSDSDSLSWHDLVSICHMWDNSRTPDADGEMPAPILPLHRCADGRVISESARGDVNAEVWAYVEGE